MRNHVAFFACLGMLSFGEGIAFASESYAAICNGGPRNHVIGNYSSVDAAERACAAHKRGSGHTGSCDAVRTR